MKNISRFALPVLCAASLSSCFTGPPKTYNYGGQYTDVTADPAFQMNVDQTELNANISFLTGKAPGKAAGTGIGNVDHAGALVFSFEDRSGNQGMGKLEPAGESYKLSISPTNVRNQKAAVLFGAKTLTKK